MLPRRVSPRFRSWLLRGTGVDLEVARSVDVSDEDAERPWASGGITSWHLERWLSSSRATLYSLHEALGGAVPLGLSSLERVHFEQTLQQRLLRALRQGELVVREVPRRTYVAPPFATEEPLRPEAPAPRPAPAPPPVEMDVSAQVLALRKAAEHGVPFCEECEKKRQQRKAA